MALADSPIWLLPAQALTGIGTVACFFVAGALVGDASAPADRGVAMGILTTSMGLGFAIGTLCTPQGSWRLVLASMALSGVAILGLAWRGDYPSMVVLLIAEGISFGIFLTAGQAFVSHHVPPQQLGAALGSYNTAGGISATISPILLGILAANVSIPAVFVAVGVTLLGGMLVLLALGSPTPLSKQPSEPPASHNS
ncbi:MAG: hypothetical protein Fur005_32980 [Roseiflexaceae bacterium]